jgi:DNA-binding transcriptional ArsR family regulator
MKSKFISRFDEAFLTTSTEMLRAIAHPIRLAIIDVLHKGKEMTVTEIYEALKIEQAIASHHLRILKDKKVVASKRDGKNSYYTLRSDDFANILAVLERQVLV